ncbi:hypothetical protein EON63_11750 [archaeon]|nr:MAG: hypothetical protein EON63_11750 [archaeon]
MLLHIPSTIHHICNTPCTMPHTPPAPCKLVTALTSNYIFAALSEDDIQEVALAMEKVVVSKGEHVITQVG